MSHNFIIPSGDTDSIMISKSSGEPFLKEEQEALLTELNSLFPENIEWAHDGYFPRVIIFKAKNYVLYDGINLKFKGSSLKSPTLEPALLEFIDTIIKSMIEDRKDYKDIYQRYVKEINDVKDIKRWCSRKTISEKTLTSSRTNESKVRDAVVDSEYVEGDRIYTFFNSKDELVLVENFNKDYNKEKLLEKLFKASGRFTTVLDKNTFINYKLKRNQKALNILLGVHNPDNIDKV